MEIKKNCETLYSKAVSYETAAEQPIQCDITLPDYFPDIVRIVRCEMRPGINSVSQSSGKLNTEGRAVVSVLYISDDGKAHCFEQRVPFSRAFDIKESSDKVYCVDVKTEYINCRVVSQRKLDIHTSISISVKEIYRKPDEYFCGCELESMNIKSTRLQAATLRDYAERYFTVNETLETASQQPPVSQIVSSAMNAVLTSTKLISDKILLKGGLNIRIVYLSEGQKDFQRVDCVIPFSQIIDISCAEDSEVFVKLSESSFDVFAKTDSSGALRLFDFSAVLKASVSVYDRRDTQIATDLYSTEYEVNPQFRNAEILQLADSFSQTLLTRESIELHDDKIISVIDASVSVISADYRFADGKLKIFGDMIIKLLAVAQNQGVISIEKQTSYEYERAQNASSDSLEAELSVKPGAMSFNLISDNSVDIREELEISSLLFERSTVRLISDVELSDTKKQDKISHSITVYFADRGESVWDIAKRYNSSPDRIMKENGISSDTLESDIRLIITA